MSMPPTGSTVPPHHGPRCSCRRCLEAFGIHSEVIGAIAEVAIHGRSLVMELHRDGAATIEDPGDADPTDVLLEVRCASHVTGLAIIVPGRVVASEVAGLCSGFDVITAHQVLADGSRRCFGLSPGGQTIWSKDCEGLIIDVMLRAFGLSTPRPSRSVSWYWLVVWLADLATHEPCPQLIDAARWHPGIDPRDLDSLSEGDIERLVACAHREHAARTGWEGVRLAATRGWLDLGFCPPALASWLDEGSLSRWMADQLPHPGELECWIDANLSGRTRRLLLDLLIESVAPKVRSS